MERITGTNLKIIENCVSFSRQFLLLPPKIDYYFEDSPSQLFPTINNAAESDGKVIFFNKQWFIKRTKEHVDDLEFFIFHELRHIHQLYSIFLYDNKLHCNDDPSTIEIWRKGFNSYVRNTDDTTTAINVSQEIEIDANAYAQCLVNLLHIDDDLDLCFSLPDIASQLSFERSKEYYSKPELARYIQAYRNNQQRKH